MSSVRRLSIFLEIVHALWYIVSGQGVMYDTLPRKTVWITSQGVNVDTLEDV